MNLQPMTMDKDAAEAAFKEYRAAFMAERNQIDGELMRGYKALREGKQLIRLTETIRAGGVDSRHLPRLAIARADERTIIVTRDTRGGVTFEPSGQRVRARDRRFALPEDTLPRINWDERPDTMQALVPMVPPRFRPRAALTGYHVLWEAEWQRVPRAPRDPALLKHLGGDLWAVLAIWDLTELERAVLEMRAN